MFHRFNDKNERETGQGSFSAQQLEAFIQKTGPEKFIQAEEMKKLRLGKSTNLNKICLTFDDGLTSQFENAKPILDKFDIKGFWFLYTKTFEKKIETNELLNYVVARYFENFQQFYQQFEKHISPKRINWKDPDFIEYKSKLESLFDFYSLPDKKFRFLRNFVLSGEEFDNIVYNTVAEAGFNENELIEEIWMDQSDIATLVKDGHEVGLHSHTHPYQIAELNYKAQLDEYDKNFCILKKITGLSPVSVAHPLGSYNQDTLDILKKLNITFGFRSNSRKVAMKSSHRDALLQLPRIDSNAISL
jgi:peptidoglycan/xylan/chitin deacetylase (PgdA/CDA1 family)